MLTCKISLLLRFTVTLHLVSALLSPPRVNVSLPDVRYVLLDFYSAKGNRIEFNCTATGNPQPTYEWLFSNESIDNFSPINNRTNHDMVIQDGSIIMKPRNKEHLGFVKCVASNEFGKAMSSIVELREMARDPFYASPEQISVTAYEGYYLTLFCRNKPYMDYIPKYHYNWSLEKVGISTHNPLKPSRRIAIDLDGNLHILQIQPNDASVGSSRYKCVVTNDLLGTSYEGSYTKLRVERYDSPIHVWKHYMIEYSSESMIVHASSDFTLHCIPRGVPISDLIWTKSGVAVKQIKNRLIIQQFTRELVIKNATSSDEGTYRCHLALKPSVYKDINVKIISKPIIIEPKPKNYFAFVGSNMTFVSTASTDYSFGEITTIWYKNAERLTSNTSRLKISGSRLTLTNLRIPNDFMSLGCLLTNGAGSTYVGFTLTVLKKTNVTKVLLSIYPFHGRPFDTRYKDFDVVSWPKGRPFTLGGHLTYIKVFAEHDANFTYVRTTWYLNDVRITTSPRGHFFVLTATPGLFGLGVPKLDIIKKHWAPMGKYTCKLSIVQDNPATDVYFNITVRL